MTDFKGGQRVRVADPFSIFEGDEGTVVAGNYPAHVAVALLGDELPKRYFWPWQLTSIEQAPTSPAKPECYVTAWVYADDEGFSLTDGDVFTSKEEADARAKYLASSQADTGVAVFKMVSKHSSAVTVTSEDV